MMGFMELNPTVSWGRSVRSQSYCPCCVHTLYLRFDFLGSGIYGQSLDIHVPPPGTCRLLLLCIDIRGFVLSSWISLQKAPETPLIIILISINLLKILFPYVCRSFAWKLAATFLCGFNLAEGKDSKYHFEVCSFKGKAIYSFAAWA